MLKHEGQKQYRFYKPRRPGGMYGEGLKLEGVSSLFGLIGIGLLMAVGVVMLMVTTIPSENELAPVSIQVQAPPYRTIKLKNSVLLSISGAQVMALDPATFAAADTVLLFGMKKGDKLTAWLTLKEAEEWKAGTGRKDFYKAILLRQSNGNWIVDYPAYHKKARKFSNQGWWLILLGAIFIPYQLIQRPKIKAPIALGLFLLVVILFYFLF